MDERLRFTVNTNWWFLRLVCSITFTLQFYYKDEFDQFKPLAYCTKHKFPHACGDFGCWTSLSAASLKARCMWLTVFGVAHKSCWVGQCKASFLFGLFTLLQNCMSDVVFCIHALKSGSTVSPFHCACHSLDCSFHVLKAVRAAWRHVQLMLHAQTVWCPDVKFLLWISITVIQGNLETPWSDRKSRGGFTCQPRFAGWYPSECEGWAHLTQRPLF